MPRFAIVIDDDIPRLVTGLEWEHNHVRIDDKLIAYEDAKHCSDCYEAIRDREINRALQREGISTGGTGGRQAIVAHDGKTVFYQTGVGRDDGDMKLYVRDLDAGTDRLLTTHDGPCAVADYMRASPDGRYLAFQVATGCAFANPALLYILDVESAERWYVKSNVFYEMHWTSDSKRLYFAKRESYQSPLFIHYVDIPEVDGDEADESAEGDVELKPAE